MSWFPDVISAAYIIASAVEVVRPIAHLHSDGSRITPVIRSVARRGGVIASTSY